MFGKKSSKPRGDIDTLIGAKTSIQGNIEFSGGLRVDGNVRGNVIATGENPSTLILSEQATIEGKVQASHVIIHGTIVGPTHAYEYLELQPKALLSGDVHYGVIEIKLGAMIEGKLVYSSSIESDEKVVETFSATSEFPNNSQ